MSEGDLGSFDPGGWFCNNDSVEHRRGFFHDLQGSFYSPEYYRSLSQRPLVSSLKFFTAFFLCFGVLVAGLVTFKWLLPLNEVLQVLPDELANSYPQELEIVIDRGTATVNVEEPYKIPLSVITDLLRRVQGRVLGANSGKITNFLVIDTEAKVEDIFEYQTFFLLGETFLAYRDDDGTIEVVSLSDFDKVVVNADTFSAWTSSYAPYLKYVVPVLFILTVFLSVLIYPLLQLAYLFFYAPLLWLISRLVTFPLSFWQAYQWGLHLVVVVTSLTFLGLATSFLPRIPFLRTILLLVWGAVMLKQVKNREGHRNCFSGTAVLEGAE